MYLNKKMLNSAAASGMVSDKWERPEFIDNYTWKQISVSYDWPVIKRKDEIWLAESAVAIINCLCAASLAACDFGVSCQLQSAFDFAAQGRPTFCHKRTIINVDQHAEGCTFGAFCTSKRFQQWCSHCIIVPILTDKVTIKHQFEVH